MPTGVWVRTPEHRAKLAAGQLGRKHSSEHRAAQSAGWTPEVRARVSAAHKGRKRPEHAALMLGNRHVLEAPVKGECVYCGAPATTYDHAIPRGRLGWDDPENRVLACRACNFSKQARTPAEWLADGLRAS